MDRRVKERLVGATILAVLIVLIVPELLSGPKPNGAVPTPSSVPGPAEPLRNVTVDLATSKATPADETSASAAAVATPSGPAGTAGSEAAAGSDAATGPDGPTIVTLKAQPAAHADGAKPDASSEPAAPRPPAAPTPAPGRRWEVQLGSFASRPNADKLVRQLKAEDPSLHVSSSGKGAALRYRVRIGPLEDRESAERVMTRMRKEGRSASLVPP
jgi:DedD protein